jgi:hypothetical protein
MAFRYPKKAKKPRVNCSKLRIDPTVTAEAYRFEARLLGRQASLRTTVSNTVVEQ